MKKLVALILALCLCLGLCACNGSSTNKTTPSTKATAVETRATEAQKKKIDLTTENYDDYFVVEKVADPEAGLKITCDQIVAGELNNVSIQIELVADALYYLSGAEDGKLTITLNIPVGGHAERIIGLSTFNIDTLSSKTSTNISAVSIEIVAVSGTITIS